MPLLDRALQQQDRRDFPPTTYGFSLGYAPDGNLESFTLFAMAASFSATTAAFLTASPRCWRLMAKPCRCLTAR